MFCFECMCVCLCVLHICIVMQQKVVSAIYKLKYCKMLVKICCKFESVWKPVLSTFVKICTIQCLIEKKFEIYITIIIMLTIAIRLTQNYPYPQSSIFLSWQLAAISCQVHHPFFNLDDYSQPHFCHKVSTYILWPSITSRVSIIDFKSISLSNIFNTKWCQSKGCLL